MVTSGSIAAHIKKAENYYEQAETIWKLQETNPDLPVIPFNQRISRAIISRLKGDLNLARELFESCIGQLHWSYSVANLYRELALVEHLAGNKELAHSHERKGTKLLKQLGYLHFSHINTHLHGNRIIKNMKEEGTW